jgi:hypothetical protein
MKTPSSEPAISLDWWAVLISLAVALLVKFGILKGIPW